MARHCTLLCIHRDPARLSLLEENGYELVNATNGYDGLQLFMSRCVDAIVLEYPLGVSNGTIITTEIKQVRPKLPIVMLADHAHLPDAVLKSVDALVHISDPAHILWAVVHFLLSVVPAMKRTSDRKCPYIGRVLAGHENQSMAARCHESSAMVQVKNEHFRPAIPSLWAHHNSRASNSALSFRSSELSQPI